MLRRGNPLPTIRLVTLFACFPVCWFFAALGLLFVLVMLASAYNRDTLTSTSSDADAIPAPQHPKSWWWLIAVIITIVIPTAVLLVIWLAPEW